MNVQTGNEGQKKSEQSKQMAVSKGKPTVASSSAANETQNIDNLKLRGSDGQDVNVQVHSE